MAVAAQPPSSPRSAGGHWPSPDELQRLAPVIRLMTAVGAVPQVTKLAMSTSGTGIDLWVFMAEDDYEAEGLISLAERDFLNSGCPPIVLIHVVPGNDIDLNMLPPMTVLLER